MDNRKPLISVVMSAYNAEQFLADAIESILNQTFRNFEFVIINDGSTDKTADILNKYKDRDSRIVLIDNGTNIGMAKSFNVGIRHSRGRFIARMDADDISAPTRFERQIEMFTSNEVLDVVSSWYSIIDINGEYVTQIKGPCQNEEIKRVIYNNMNIPFCHGSVTMKKESIEKVGLYREEFRYPYPEDYDLWLRLYENNSVFYVIPEYLYKYRVSPDSISVILHAGGRRTYNRISRKAILEGADIHSLLEQSRLNDTDWKNISESKKKAYYYRTIGARKVDSDRISSARNDLLKAIRYNPLLLSAWYYLLLGLFPASARRRIKKIAAYIKHGVVF